MQATMSGTAIDEPHPNARGPRQRCKMPTHCFGRARQLCRARDADGSVRIPSGAEAHTSRCRRASLIVHRASLARTSNVRDGATAGAVSLRVRRAVASGTVNVPPSPSGSEPRRSPTGPDRIAQGEHALKLPQPLRRRRQADPGGSGIERTRRPRPSRRARAGASRGACRCCPRASDGHTTSTLTGLACTGGGRVHERSTGALESRDEARALRLRRSRPSHPSAAVRRQTHPRRRPRVAHERHGRGRRRFDAPCPASCDESSARRTASVALEEPYPPVMSRCAASFANSVSAEAREAPSFCARSSAA